MNKNCHNLCIISLSLLYSLFPAPYSLAAEIAQQPEPDPNRDRLLPLEGEFFIPIEDELLIPELDPSDDERQESISFLVTKIEVQDSTVFTEADFAPIISPLEGQKVTFVQLQEAADAITQLYLEAGYINSRAILAEQTIDQGIVKIQVIEGTLTEIQINGLAQTNSNYVRDRVKRGISKPFNINDLEDKLRLLKTDPLFADIATELQLGENIGEAILVLDITEAQFFSSNISVDNYSSASIGSERMGIALSYRNLTGLGDNITAAYTRSMTGGSNVFDFGYSIPVNAKNGTLQLRAVLDQNEVTQSPFNSLGINGESRLYEIGFRQTIIRTSTEEFALSAGFSYREGQTFIFEDIGVPFGIGAEPDGTTRTSVFRFGQDYLKRDSTGAWALRSQFKFGTSLFDATSNSGDIPDGEFFSWSGQVQRVQRLAGDNLLILQLDGQFSPDNLLASETFTIGGGTTVRGFRQGARSGDNGLRLTLEDRITLERDSEGGAIFQFAPFVDLGVVFDNEDNPNIRPRQNFLASAGAGILWEPIPNLNLRLDLAFPLVELDDQGESLQDNGVHFTVSYLFGESPRPKKAPKIQITPTPNFPPPSGLGPVVKKVEVTGSTVLQEEIATIVEQYINREVNFSNLIELRSDIAKLYFENGYVTSGAFLPNNQDLNSGIINIQVVEGELEQIQISGLNRLRESYVRSRLGAALTKPLNQQKLEEALQLLQLDPLIAQVNTELTAGSFPGRNNLLVNLKEAPAFHAGINVDNNSSPSIGSQQGIVFASHDNLLGFGDRLSGEYSLTEGLNLANISYTIPFNGMNGTFNVSYNTSNSSIIEADFQDLGIRSESQNLSVNLRQPLARSPTSEFALGLGLDLGRSQTFLLDNIPFSFSPGPIDGLSRITAIRFTQDWVKRNPQQVLAARSQFSFGIDAFDATINDTGTDGRFLSWLGQFQWVRQLSPGTVLLTRLNAQITPDSLLPLERFSIGGVNTIRGYPQNQLVGDNGILASVEARISLTSNPGQLQVVPFLRLVRFGIIRLLTLTLTLSLA